MTITQRCSQILAVLLAVVLTSCGANDNNLGSEDHDGGSSTGGHGGANTGGSMAGGTGGSNTGRAGAGGTGGSCTYNGKTYATGQSFPCTDGCNTCGCNADGSISTTLMACAGGGGNTGGSMAGGRSGTNTGGSGAGTAPDAGRDAACPLIACPAIACQGGMVPNPSDPCGCPVCANRDAGVRDAACPPIACPAIACLAGMVPNPNDPCGCPVCGNKDAGAPDAACPLIACPAIACLAGMVPNPNDPCGCPVCGNRDAGQSDGNAGAGDAASTHWYQTCGEPVCRLPTDAGSGVPPCTTEKVGDPCATSSSSCDPGLGCGVLLACGTKAPTTCPISRREYKQDIQYLGDESLAKYRSELLGMKLATWRYKHDPSRERLGFIIDDSEGSVAGSVAVEGTGNQVDLYGYTSLAVATLQLQAKQIAALESEVASLRSALAGKRSSRAATSSFHSSLVHRK